MTVVNKNARGWRTFIPWAFSPPSIGMQHDISALKKRKKDKRVTSQLDLLVSEDLSVLASIPRGIVLILARGYNTYLPRQVNTNIPPQGRMRRNPVTGFY